MFGIDERIRCTFWHSTGLDHGSRNWLGLGLGLGVSFSFFFQLPSFLLNHSLDDRNGFSCTYLFASLLHLWGDGFGRLWGCVQKRTGLGFVISWLRLLFSLRVGCRDRYIHNSCAEISHFRMRSHFLLLPFDLVCLNLTRRDSLYYGCVKTLWNVAYIACLQLAADG